MPLTINLQCTRPIIAQKQYMNYDRRASTSSSTPYPYPAHNRPKPHEIFHLAEGASQAEIKERYIDLVKAHHPDSTRCSHIPANERHSRFQAISAAYDQLRGKRPLHDMHAYNDRFNEELQRRGRGRRAHGTNQTRSQGRYAHEDPWPHGTETAALNTSVVPILLAGLVIVLGVLPGLAYRSDHRHESASFHLAEARKEAREWGQDRRREIRRQARKYELVRQEENQYRDHSCQSVGVMQDNVEDNAK